MRRDYTPRVRDERWHGVRDRVTRLQNMPGIERVFGSTAHRFALAPPLAEAEVDDAEQSFKVRLPDDYRGFLLHVGAGGAGPGCGLLTLRRTAHAWDWAGGDPPRSDLGRLHQPFAPWHVDGVPIDPLRLRMPVRYNFEYGEDFKVAYQLWEKAMWHPDRTAGAVCLCDEGCLRCDWLVVTGDERGMVWRDYRIDGIDLAPLFDARGCRLDFGQWYLGWLDKVEHHGQSS